MEANSLGRNMLSRWREKLKNVYPTLERGETDAQGQSSIPKFMAIGVQVR